MGNLQFTAIYSSAFGAYQLGALFSWGLHGILCVQMYNYFTGFRKDPIPRKLLACFVFMIETVQTVCVTRDIYRVTVLSVSPLDNFGMLDELGTIPFSVPILAAIMGLICHLMFAYHISQISKLARLPAILIVLLGCASSTFAILLGGKLFATATLSNMFRELTSESATAILPLSSSLWHGFGAGCDAIIAVCMTFFLLRRTVHFRKTELLIIRVILLTIEANIITAAASIASAILFVGYRTDAEKSIYFVLPVTILTKMYGITILATFNNRQMTIGGPSPTSSDAENATYGLRSFHRSKWTLQNVQQIQIGQTVDQEVWSDELPTTHDHGTFREKSTDLISGSSDMVSAT